MYDIYDIYMTYAFFMSQLFALCIDAVIVRINIMMHRKNYEIKLT